ncbi:hypothetical protein JOM56_004694 [Amanita muscaria]
MRVNHVSYLNEAYLMIDEYGCVTLENISDPRNVPKASSMAGSGRSGIPMRSGGGDKRFDGGNFVGPASMQAGGRSPFPDSAMPAATRGHASGIQDNITNDDSRPYLQLSPSQEVARKQLQDRAESGNASDVRTIRKHIIGTDVPSIPFPEKFNTRNFDEAKMIRLIMNLPRAQASHKDYETKNKGGPCFPGTREALLREMMDWMTDPDESKMYVLSGLAGIGKSSVAYTLATQAGCFTGPHLLTNGKVHLCLNVEYHTT